MVMVMLVIMFVVTRQKFRFDLQNAVEIESIAAKHFRQRNGAALGAMHFGIGIDAPDAALDLLERAF